jgi:c-di-GMP phosphodiesterase
MSSSYVARQAVYDRRLRTVGYELLFRSTVPGPAGALEETDTGGSARALVATLADIGLDTLVGETWAFVSASRTFIVDGQIRACPADRVIIEVNEENMKHPDVVAALRGLVADSYQISLGDVADGGTLAPLMALASIVRIGMRDRTEPDLARRLDELRPFHQVKALAEGVETQAQLELCMQLGFSYFQGSYFSHPQVQEGEARVIEPGRLSQLQLIAALQDESVDPERLETLVARDLGLSQRVLLFVNSAHTGLARRVHSIREAVLMLGYRKLRLFATLVVLGDTGDLPRELFVTSLVRARMCELLARETGVDPDSAFTVGLFSIADALLGTSMDEIVERLPFADDTKAALAVQAGPLGKLLAVALAYEQGIVEPAEIGQTIEQCEAAYLNAVAWSGAVARTPMAA